MIPEILVKVDENYLPFKAAVELSYITKEKQLQLYHFVIEHGYRIDHDKAIKLRNIFCDETASTEVLAEVFEEKKPKKNSHVKLLRKDLKRFFSDDINSEEIIKRIYC